MPDFPGPPPDAWIDQLDEYGVTSRPQLTPHHHWNVHCPNLTVETLMAHHLTGLRGLEI